MKESGREAIMGEKRDSLGSFEEIILRIVLGLGQEAYGVRVRQKAEQAMEKSVAIGAVYTTLDRLERKGFVSSWQGEATPERGGRAKRYFRVESLGIRALNNAEETRRRVSEGLALA
jgi:PadR family transcriptional regulator PadR